MKKVAFIFLFIMTLFTKNVFAQVAQATCTSVSLVSPPTYNGSLVTSSSWVCTNCNGQCYDKLYSNTPTYLTIYSYLQRKVNGVWQSYGTGQGKYGDYPSWTVTDPGTYRIKIIKPAILPDAACPQGRDVLNASGSYVGKRGYTPISSSTPVYSNEVTAGVVTADQINFTFVDGSGGNSNNFAFDYLELARINTSNCKNYNQYSISIYEGGGANRTKTTGIMSGTMPTIFDLTNLWRTNNPTWNFEMSWYYNVNITLYNSCSSSGTSNNQTFTICPPGSGCREIIQEDRDIKIAPNPVSNNMLITDLPSNTSTILLTDVTGRLVKNFSYNGTDRFDVSDLGNGMYFVNIMDIEGNSIYESKIILQN